MFSVLLASQVAVASVPCKADYVQAYAAAGSCTGSSNCREVSICRAVDAFAMCASKSRAELDLADTNELDMYLSSAMNAVTDINCASLASSTYGTLSAGEVAHLDTVDGTDVTGPRIRSLGAGLDVKVARSQDVSFQRIEIEELTKGTVSAAIKAAEDQANAVKAAWKAAGDLKTKIQGDVTTASAKLDKTTGAISGLQSRFATIDSTLNGIADTTATELAEAKTITKTEVEKTKMTIRQDLDNKIKSINAEIARQISKVQASMTDVNDNLKTPLAAVQAGAGKAYDALKTTHYLNPDTMYYRWNEWNTYSNSWSWFDGNNGRGYGGVAPSQWGDGNVRANQMNSGMKYMKRLFSKPGKGDNFGSTVCAYAWMMPHSTDDHRCGAFFRILNTGTSAKRWTIQWHWTGWSGWGNKASLAVNKANWWSGSCYGICSRSENIEIKADTKGTRINNVVFVNGASHPYYHNNYYRMSYLSFSNTKLPAGLEYVDDLSTATGNWV